MTYETNETHPKKGETRAKVVDYALMQFQQHGSKRVKMDDIATGLRMSKRTLYELYSNKEEIVEACLETIHCRIRHKWMAQLKQSSDPFLMMTYLLHNIQRFKTDFQRLLSDIRHYYPKTYQAFMEKNEAMLVQNTEQALQQDVAQGNIRADANIRLAAKAMSNIVSWAQSLYPDNDSEQDNFATEIAFTLLRGLMSEKALERYQQHEPLLYLQFKTPNPTNTKTEQ